MAKKTGKTLVKMRQQMRAAKLARYKRELVQAGVDLSLPKPSMQARKEKDEELKKLYAELLSKSGEGEQEKSAEQPLTQEEQEKEPSQEGKGHKTPAQKPTEESEHGS